MLNSSHHVLIVGQGIAGTVLSFKLNERSISHKVIDNRHKTAATHAAAGIINPITGRNYVKSWMIEKLLPVAKSTYNTISKKLNHNYVREMNIIRALHTASHENNWLSSVEKNMHTDYMIEGPVDNIYHNIAGKDVYYGEINGSIQVDISKMITDYRHFLIERGQYIESTFEYDSLKIFEDRLSYKNEIFDRVIFCEGYKGKNNPYFSKLPFVLAKGEAFILDLATELPNKMLNDDLFLVPIENNRLWTGGTYQWEFIDEKPSRYFNDLWTDKLIRLMKVNYSISKHIAGIRPTIKDRRPLIGYSPMSKLLYMFNGMGTKATSLVPFWSEHLLDHLIYEIPLNNEIDITRFY